MGYWMTVAGSCGLSQMAGLAAGRIAAEIGKKKRKREGANHQNP